MPPLAILSRRTLFALAPCLLLALVSGLAFAADAEGEKPIETEIISATVYGHQAQMVRRAAIELEPGSVRLVCSDLPPTFLETSLHVEGFGLEGARIVGIDMRRTEKKEVDSPRYKELEAELEELILKVARFKVRRTGLRERKELARSIKNFSAETGQDNLAEGTFTTAYWGNLLSFMEKETVETDDRIDDLAIEMREVEDRMNWVASELKAMRVGETPGREVIVDCEAAEAGELTVEISYLIPNASWSPEYTIRHLEAEGQIELDYSARIHQATGEDWKDVSVLLSTATPHIGASPPEITPHLLGTTDGSVQGMITDAETGKPLPFANVSVMGTSVGTLSNQSGTYVLARVPAGRYRIQVSYMGYATENRRVRVIAGRGTRVDFALRPQRIAAEEIVVEAERPMIDVEKTATRRSMDEAGVRVRALSTVEEAIATQPGVVLIDETPARPEPIPHLEAEIIGTEFAANLSVPKPVSLNTGDEPKRSLVVRERMPGELVLVSVPRLSEHVFVKGTFTNRLEIPILPGEAEVYVETAPAGAVGGVSNFVGQDRLPAVASGETFELYLGADQNVTVEHELEAKEVLSKARDKTTKVRYSYSITAESYKRDAAELWVIDRIPVSRVKEIKVDDIEILPPPDEQTEDGLLTWKLQIAPGQKHEITIEYVIEYPSEMTLRDVNLEG
jgi:hypothetical protein